MQEFFEQMKRLHRGRRLDGLGTDVDLITSARHQLERARLKSRLDVDNLESIYTALEMVETIGGIDGLSRERAREAQQSLDRLIVATLEQSVRFPVKRDETGGHIQSSAAYGQLAAEAEAIRERFPSFPITFVTFNYDLAFDVALAQQEVKVWYGFEDVERPKKRVVSYFKLHGSIHWAIDKRNKLVDAPIDLGRLDGNVLSLTAKWVCLQVGEQLWQERRDDLRRYPFIVPPSTNKRELQNLISPVWSHASRALREAEIVVLIGYSLPKADQFFRHFFALSTIGPTGLQRIVVIDPSELVCAELRGLLSPDLHPRISFEQTTFEDSIPGLQNLLSEYLGEWGG